MTRELFQAFTGVGAGWVLYLLLGLSVISLALMVERLVFFLRFSWPGSQEVLELLARGELAAAQDRASKRTGMEAEALLSALEVADGGARAVEQRVASVIAKERLAYERSLAYLGTLGNNAPFIGLFGTVIGIIKAFADLSVGGAKAAGASAVMAGLSEALVATAVGIFVAIPAVAAFNAFSRWLKTIIGRSQALGHALCAHLECRDSRSAPPMPVSAESSERRVLAVL